MSITYCLICSQNISGDMPYHEYGVCGECVVTLAKAYWLKHSGQPSQEFDPDGYRLAMAGRKPKRQPMKRSLVTQVYERDEYRCKSCGTHKGLTVDHIHPKSKGGTDDLDNLQTLCHSCNASKGARADG